MCAQCIAQIGRGSTRTDLDLDLPIELGALGWMSHDAVAVVAKWEELTE